MTKKPDDLKRIHALIDAARRVLMITHVAPDGDAIGSLLGLGWYLQALGKLVTLACEDPVPDSYRSLPGSDRVVQRVDGAYDLVISLDCSDRRRMGSVYDDAWTSIPVINIDHHVTNTLFGTVNWVDVSRAATAHIILDLADAYQWQTTEAIATCLLTGIVTDTRSFRTSNVDRDTVQAALHLMDAGASLSEVARRSLEQRPLSTVRLWGQAFERLHLEDGILWTEITSDMRRAVGLPENGSKGLANFLSGIREAQVVVVFAERDDDTVDVGMRSVPGIDVAQVALSLGGGGHPQASGCTLAEPLPDVKDRVLTELRRSLAQQR
ncbi:MAG: bifunctional oligoribonuclease/PAP phosphatase NrnA [Anaerolineae bacterium]|jgi:phosphoesterase RecJ-like protein